MINKIMTDGAYIIGTAETSFGNDANSETVEQILRNQPSASDGYFYRLRADNLQWELCELPPEEPSEATEADFLQALEEVGVIDTD